MAVADDRLVKLVQRSHQLPGSIVVVEIKSKACGINANV